MERKGFVVVTKKTGELAEAYRMQFYDQDGSQELVGMPGYSVGILRHDGWIFFHPDVSLLPAFVSFETFDLYFEVLGEL